MGSHRMYKIVFCTPALYSAGGTERVVACKASFFAEKLGYDVTIIVTEGAGNRTFFTLSDRVQIINLGINFEEIWRKPFLTKVVLYLKKQYQYRKRLSKLLKDIAPDVTITTLRREINFIHKIKDGSLKIGELHLSRNYYRGAEASELHLVKRLFVRWWRSDVVRQLKKLDRVVLLTDCASREWPELSNKVVIADPMTLNITRCSLLNSKRVIAIGRYSYEKGYDLLLQIWSVVEKRVPDWELDIYGMGDPSPYVKLLTELSIDKNRCHLNACLVDVSKVYRNSSILVQPSRTEGFGLVIVEAMAHGLPVVSFDCENGPRTIITEGEDGFLVPSLNIGMFAERLICLMKDEKLRFAMGENGRRKSMHYSLETISLQWKQFLENMIQNR